MLTAHIRYYSYTIVYHSLHCRNLLLVLKKWGATNFIVWCNATCSARVLDAAQRVGLLADRHAYIVAALDLHTVPLADYSYGGANITGVLSFYLALCCIPHITGRG